MIDSAPDRARTHVRYVVLAWLCAAAAFAYLQRNCIAVAESTIRAQLGLSIAQMGWVMSAFFVTYAIFQIPTGWAADRLGSRRLLSWLSVLWSVASGLMALAGGFTSLLLWRYVAGAAQAGIFPCTTCTLGHWMPRSERGRATGLLAAFMSVGAVVASALTGWLIDDWQVDWRWLVAAYSVPGLLWAACFYMWFRDTPEAQPTVSRSELQRIRGGPDDPTAAASLAPVLPWRVLLKSRTLWGICGQQFFRAAGYIFYTTWFPTFLQEAHAIGVAESGALTSLPLVAVIGGSVIGGFLSDAILMRTGSRRLARQVLAAVSMIACALLILVAGELRDATWAVLVISAGSLCSAIGGPCAYAVTIDLGGKQIATVFGAMNMTGNVGAAVFPFLTGWLVETTGNWRAVLVAFAGVYAAAAVCWMLLGRTDSLAPDPARIGDV